MKAAVNDQIKECGGLRTELSKGSAVHGGEEGFVGSGGGAEGSRKLTKFQNLTLATAE